MSDMEQQSSPSQSSPEPPPTENKPVETTSGESKPAGNRTGAERRPDRGPRPAGSNPQRDGNRMAGRDGGREGNRDGNRGGNRDGQREGNAGRSSSSGPSGGGPNSSRLHQGRPGSGRPFEMIEIDLEKLLSDSLYLDNQAHAVVGRMRDMDSGTKSQLRRFYNAVRRACRTPESERQHEFVMLRARLAYTIARHSLRSLDSLEKLLLQVTRKNDSRGYDRFRDLFEAIIAYNE
jgi:CRISPR type III-A-associated protein Csm2